MAAATIPLPSTLPARTGVRLYRLSGRPVPMYLDAAKTQGPVFYHRTATSNPAGPDVYADPNVYDLLLEYPDGTTTRQQVQVGTGATPAPPTSDAVTFPDLDTALAAERSVSDGKYADVAAPETISAPWNFTTAPTVNGGPITGTGAGDVTTAQLDSRLATERATSDSRYADVGQPETIGGAWNFTTAPTVNGSPIAGGGTTDQTARNAAAAAQTTADSKYLKPTAGIPSTDLTTTVQGQLTAASKLDLTTRAPADGDLLFYDADAGRFTPGPAPQVTTDPYAGRFIVVNPGVEPPADFGAGIVFERAAATALGLTETGKAFVNNGTALTITLTSEYAVGDWMILAVGNSGETAATTFTAAVSPVSTSGFTQAVTHSQGLTTQATLLYGRVTTAIASGATVTVTANTARNDLVGKALKIVGLGTTGVLDQTAINGAGNVTAASVGPTSTTAQASEIAVAAFTFNDSVLGFAAGAGWTEAGTKATTGDASPRAIAVQYKVLTTAQAVTAPASFTRPAGDTTSNTAYSGVLATLRAA